MLNEIATFAQKQTDAANFMKLLATKDERLAQIDSYYRRIDALVVSLQVCSKTNLLRCDLMLQRSDLGSIEHTGLASSK